MQKKISLIICGILFLLIACLANKNIVTDKNYSASSFSAKQNDEVTTLKSSKKKDSKIALLDTLKVNSKTRIIGKCYDHNNRYDWYSFLLKDTTSMVQFAKSLKAGKKLLNFISRDEFNIYIVNDYLMTQFIAINPVLNTIRINGNTYEFDFNQIRKISKKHPLYCDDVDVDFNNKKELNDYLIEIKKDTNLLYYFAPEFKYEGSFTMDVKKTLFSSPKAIMDFLSPEIEKIVMPGEYMCSYVVDLSQIDKVTEGDSYTIAINGSKKLFNDLNVDEFKKDNWESFAKAVGTFCMKRN